MNQKMDIDKLKKITKEIKNNFIENENVIKEAINKELENGYIIHFEDLIEEIENAEKNIIENNIKESENQDIAIIYKGYPEVTINIIINSIFFNNKVCFVPEGYEISSVVIIELINNILEEFNLKHRFSFIDRIEDIIENENNYNKIVYIGDFFEYQNEKCHFNKKLEYNSYGFLKVYIDKMKYKEEYKELIKYSYKRNISIEYYEEINDFIENVKEQDSVIIYETMDNMENILNKIKPKKVYTHEEFLNNYKFIY